MALFIDFYEQCLQAVVLFVRAYVAVGANLYSSDSGWQWLEGQ